MLEGFTRETLPWKSQIKYVCSGVDGSHIALLHKGNPPKRLSCMPQGEYTRQCNDCGVYLRR